ncbi:unnamed protein product [Didymodactylos carnosus]|uniref:Uncharacterized protein n=1 Tax=Didymodactylos carnosus TaxID=1234261 RepID=A0A813QVU4_9BILA|nr:unnamed protein product [Didymodactylos carnosus]CAF1530190.1 unnamed protein product [Didymodactylos carnosus]CAF3556778.1 unnamed protein product [Didymodactylos carnosus]CAF4317113.1 unnamed protein product [Didymodactylos carnosus]
MGLFNGGKNDKPAKVDKYERQYQQYQQPKSQPRPRAQSQYRNQLAPIVGGFNTPVGFGLQPAVQGIPQLAAPPAFQMTPQLFAGLPPYQNTGKWMSPSTAAGPVPPLLPMYGDGNMFDASAGANKYANPFMQGFPPMFPQFPQMSAGYPATPLPVQFTGGYGNLNRSDINQYGSAFAGGQDSLWNNGYGSQFGYMPQF